MTTLTKTKDYTQQKSRNLLGGTLAAGLFASLLVLAPGSASAQGYGYGGGFTGPGPQITTVERAKALGDDAHVALRGHIVQHLGDKDYVFKDDTGSVNIEISRKAWSGQQIQPGDLVEVRGEIDKEWNKFEIDVKQVIKVQQ